MKLHVPYGPLGFPSGAEFLKVLSIWPHKPYVPLSISRPSFLAATIETMRDPFDRSLVDITKPLQLMPPIAARNAVPRYIHTSSSDPPVLGR